jgi:hypothetical protein
MKKIKLTLIFCLFISHAFSASIMNPIDLKSSMFSIEITGDLTPLKPVKYG